MVTDLVCRIEIKVHCNQQPRDLLPLFIHDPHHPSPPLSILSLPPGGCACGSKKLFPSLSSIPYVSSSHNFAPPHKYTTRYPLRKPPFPHLLYRAHHDSSTTLLLPRCIIVGLLNALLTNNLSALILFSW